MDNQYSFFITLMHYFLLLLRIFCLIFLPSYSYAVAFTDEICYLSEIASGTGGKVVLASAVVSVGLAFFMGKVRFPVVVGLVVTIAMVSGSQSIIEVLSGDGSYDCEVHIVEINTDYSACMDFQDSRETKSSAVFTAPAGTVWTGVKYANYGAVSDCGVNDAVLASCNARSPGVVDVTSAVASRCIGKNRCNVWVGPSALSSPNPCRGGNRSDLRIGVIMSYK